MWVLFSCSLSPPLWQLEGCGGKIETLDPRFEEKVKCSFIYCFKGRWGKGMRESWKCSALSAGVNQPSVGSQAWQMCRLILGDFSGFG